MNIYLISGIVCVICVFYTFVGGIKVIYILSDSYESFFWMNFVISLPHRQSYRRMHGKVASISSKFNGIALNWLFFHSSYRYVYISCCGRGDRNDNYGFRRSFSTSIWGKSAHFFQVIIFHQFSSSGPLSPVVADLYLFQLCLSIAYRVLALLVSILHYMRDILSGVWSLEGSLTGCRSIQWIKQWYSVTCRCQIWKKQDSKKLFI